MVRDMEEHKIGQVRGLDRVATASNLRSADQGTSHRCIWEQQGKIQISMQHHSRAPICLFCLGDGLNASVIELAPELGEERKAKKQGRQCPCKL
jgi:hypothetical protein